MAWFVATVADVVVETPTARTLLLDVPGWPGHRAGQHVDLQLRAEDGYTARRSYSIASAPGAERVSLTVQRLDDGEVSPYLCDVVEPGDALEVRGPLGGWFVWPLPGRDARPTVLFGGGSGVVPLVAMARERRRSGGRAPMRLVYSVRSPDEVLYAGELAGELADGAAGLAVDLVYTRRAPPGRPVGRLGAEAVRAAVPPPGETPALYVCGPTGFVEAVADVLVDAGHDARDIRTERFGPSGGG